MLVLDREVVDDILALDQLDLDADLGPLRLEVLARGGGDALRPDR